MYDFFFQLTLMVWVKSIPIRFWSLQGSGKSWTWSAFFSELWIFRRLNSCKDPIVGETHPMWISFPVATKSLLSLWPHVIAVTGNWKKKGFFQFFFFFEKITDLGSLIGFFDCAYSTVWKFSNFPAASILREIDFGWF